MSVRTQPAIVHVDAGPAGSVGGAPGDLFELMLERGIITAFLIVAAPLVLFTSITMIIRYAGYRVLARRAVRGDAGLALYLLAASVVGFLADAGAIALLQAWGLLIDRGVWLMSVIFTLIGCVIAFWVTVAVVVSVLVFNAWRAWRHAGTVRATRSVIRLRRGVAWLGAAAVAAVLFAAAYGLLGALTPGWRTGSSPFMPFG
ncbi:MAG: hypothetical protein GC159_08455 [Phycisphaera sp.]|nr:hypothetical protein [Phycisphaera sp.]